METQSKFAVNKQTSLLQSIDDLNYKLRQKENELTEQRHEKYEMSVFLQYLLLHL